MVLESTSSTTSRSVSLPTSILAPSGREVRGCRYTVWSASRDAQTGAVGIAQQQIGATERGNRRTPQVSDRGKRLAQALSGVSVAGADRVALHGGFGCGVPVLDAALAGTDLGAGDVHRPAAGNSSGGASCSSAGREVVTGIPAMAPIIPYADRSFHNDPMEDRRSRVETAGEIGDVLDPPVTRRPPVERARPRRCYTSMMHSAAPRRIRERDHSFVRLY